MSVVKSLLEGTTVQSLYEKCYRHMTYGGGGHVVYSGKSAGNGSFGLHGEASMVWTVPSMSYSIGFPRKLKVW